MAPVTQNEPQRTCASCPQGQLQPQQHLTGGIFVFPICCSDALTASSASPTPAPGSYIQLPLGPHPIWGVSPCHSSPCSISLFLLAPDLTSHFTQQDLSQAKLFLNSCLAIIRITPGDSWARGQTILLTLRFLFLLLFHSHSLSSDVPSSRHESSSKNPRGETLLWSPIPKTLGQAARTSDG